jgi:hypothetical protein
MRNSRHLEQWLARQVLDRDLPRKPPTRERRGPSRDVAYRAWIRTLSCAACGSARNIEAAHTGRDGGMSIKSSDYSCIPLCSDCHRQAPHAYHRIGRDAFERRHSLNFPKIAARLNEMWRAS